MPQPNKGSAGKPNVSQPVRGDAGSKPSHAENIKFGKPGGSGTRGK